MGGWVLALRLFGTSSCQYAFSAFYFFFPRRVFPMVFVIFPCFSTLFQVLGPVFGRPPPSSRALPRPRTAAPRLSRGFMGLRDGKTQGHEKRKEKGQESVGKRGGAVRDPGRAREDDGGRRKTRGRAWESMENHGKTTKTMKKRRRKNDPKKSIGENEQEKRKNTPRTLKLKPLKPP